MVGRSQLSFSDIADNLALLVAIIIIIPCILERNEISSEEQTYVMDLSKILSRI